MILGIDISSIKVGIGIVDDGKNIIYSNVVKFDKEMTLFEKANSFKETIVNIKERYDIEKIYIEEALMMFGSRSSMAQVISLLQRFNGMLSFVVFDVFNMEPIMVNVNSARRKVGMKIDRTIKHKNPRQKKQPIIDFMVELYKNTKTPIIIKLNRNLNFAEGEDDRVDALVIALSHFS